MAMPVLTEQQEQAARSDAKVLKILATAGSGKTTVLIQRMVHLKQTHQTEGILGITFTRKAGAELEERLPKPRGSNINTMTFGQLTRAICLQASAAVLRELGYQSFPLRIIDTVEETQIVKELMANHQKLNGAVSEVDTNTRSEAEVPV